MAMSTRSRTTAVEGLDSFGDDDNQRGADQDARAEGGDEAELARGQGQGEGEDAGEEGAGACQSI